MRVFQIVFLNLFLGYLAGLNKLLDLSVEFF